MKAQLNLFSSFILVAVSMYFIDAKNYSYAYVFSMCAILEMMRYFDNKNKPKSNN